jgi:hypothetical protein
MRDPFWICGQDAKKDQKVCRPGTTLGAIVLQTIDLGADKGENRTFPSMVACWVDARRLRNFREGSEKMRGLCRFSLVDNGYMEGPVTFGRKTFRVV